MHNRKDKTEDRAEWLKMRRSGIGGSDAGAILGLSPWSSPYSVWADKTGRLPERPDSEAMRQGRDLEDYVARRFCEETGKRVRRENRMVRCADYPWAIANIDRRVVGERAGLECKTTGLLDLKAFKSGEYPAQYYAQCMHYLALTGAERWYLAVLVLGRGFHLFTVARDEEEIAALMRVEKTFWRYVSEDTPPPADGTGATTEALGLVYPNACAEKTADLFGFAGEAERHVRLRSQIAELEREQELCEQRLKSALGDAETGRAGPYTVSWRGCRRRSFDAKTFAQSHPEWDLEPFYRETAYRKFEIKE